MLDDENYVEPNDVMDGGGIVAPAKPKRTRAVKANGGAGSNVKAKGGESGGGLFLLIDHENNAREIPASELAQAVANTILSPSLKLYRATPVNAEFVIK